jgi:predicted hotdog family 3-hydroxylacyl-ACP dehydratase
VNAREEALDVASLLPHGAGLRLVDRVVSEQADGIVVDVTVRGDGVFGDGPTVPAWIALEYMAQAMAAWSGIQARRLGRPVRVGLLMGTRSFEATVPTFRHGDRLRVEAVRVADGEDLAVFDCRVVDDDEGTLAVARLSVFHPASFGTVGDVPPR